MRGGIRKTRTSRRDWGRSSPSEGSDDRGEELGGRIVGLFQHEPEHRVAVVATWPIADTLRARDQIRRNVDP
jgi:hypothetical protein